MSDILDEIQSTPIKKPPKKAMGILALCSSIILFIAMLLLSFDGQWFRLSDTLSDTVGVVFMGSFTFSVITLFLGLVREESLRYLWGATFLILVAITILISSLLDFFT